MKLNRLVLTFLLIASALLVNFIPKETTASANEIWKAPLENPTLLKEFRKPSSDWSAGHRGVDYLADLGQKVLATHAGVVSFSGLVVNRRVLSVQHQNGTISSYEPVCSTLAVKSEVETGSVVGSVCTDQTYLSHCAPRLCLHFSIRTPNGYLSPLVFLGGISPSRLKPWDGLSCNPTSNVQC